MTIDEAKIALEQMINSITSGDVQTYWNAFKTFCLQPIDNEGQSVVLTCLTADFPMNGHAFYVTFKRLIWSPDEDDEDELNVDQITCTLACDPSAQTQGLSLNLGGEPLSDSDYAKSIESIEKSLVSHKLHKLMPRHSSVYVA